VLTKDTFSEGDMEDPWVEDNDESWLADALTGVDQGVKEFKNITVNSVSDSNYPVLGEGIIALDTAAGESVFRDANLFLELGEGEPIIIDGINESGAPIFTSLWGVTRFGTAYLSAKSVGNILSFGKVVDEANMVYFERDSDAFYVQIDKNGAVFKFVRSIGNIYTTDIRGESDGSRVQVLVNTVKDNIANYTKREVERAKLAREYQRKLGYSAGQLVKLLNSGKIRNAEVTPHDVVRSINIWGKDLGQLKGKTTAKKSKAVNFEPVLQVRRDQVMDMDLMFVEDLKYLIAVYFPLDYTALKRLRSKGKYELWSGINRCRAYVERAGMKVHTARCDGESAIASSYIQEKMGTSGIWLDTTSAGDAVARVERKIRVIKERVRGVINTLPFMLAWYLLDWLVQYCVYRINGEVVNGGLDNLSPNERLYGRSIDAKSDLKHAFGDYVQVAEGETDNSMTERTRGAIALMPTGNADGSWWYFIFKTGKPVRRTNATALPMPEEIIEILNSLASESKSRVKAGEIIKIGNFRSAYNDEDTDHADGESDVDLDHYAPVIIEPIRVDGDLIDVDPQPIEADEYIEDDHRAMLPVTVDDIFGPDEQEYIEEEREIYRGEGAVDGEFNGVANSLENAVENRAEAVAEPRYNLRENRAQPGRWARVIAANRRYMKIHREFTRREFGLNMTVRQGIQKLGYDAILAVVQEIMSLCNMETFEGKKVTDMTEEQLKRIITSKTFLKEKFTPEGIYERLKARLVAGGHLQSREETEGASPTPATEAVFMVAAIAAFEGRAVATVDFPSAFLLADIPEDAPEVFVELNRFETKVLIKIDPTFEKFVKENGKCVVKLKKPLYGCIESARLWYQKISADFEDLGFIKNPYDECVFNRNQKDGTQETLVIHVDDVLVTAGSEKAIDNIMEELGTKYEKLTIKRGRKLDYLGMTFDFNTKGKVRITMEGFINDLLVFCESAYGVAKTPAAGDLFEVNTKSVMLSEEKKQFFHSAVAKFLYLGKRVRPDLLTAISFLSRRVQSPTEQDLKKLYRTIRYLRGSKELGIVLEPLKHVSLYAFIDASYGVHFDMRSQSGCVIGIGRGPIYAKSSAQKLNTKSSTESELVALSDNTSQVIWCRNFLIAQGHGLGAATVYQDNMSTISMVANGKSNSARTRHIAIRFFFVTDRVKNGEIKIEYMSTGNMLADILTKPLQGELFLRLRRMLLNWEE